MTETGLQIIDAEMARQFPDAARTFADQAGAAADAAAQIRRAGRLHLLGIGGSHWVNRLAEPVRAEAADATGVYLAFIEVVLSFIQQSNGELAEDKAPRMGLK